MSRFDQDNGGMDEKSSLGRFVQEWLQFRTIYRDHRTVPDAPIAGGGVRQTPASWPKRPQTSAPLKPRASSDDT
jgi:hypothetical protein